MDREIDAIDRAHEGFRGDAERAATDAKVLDEAARLDEHIGAGGSGHRANSGVTRAAGAAA